MPTLPQRRFIKGVVAATPPFEQPSGSVPRASNLLLTKRGGFITTPGSATLSKLDDVLVHAAPMTLLEVMLFQPNSGPARYIGILRDESTHLGAPINLAVADGGGGGALPAGDVFWKVTALDGVGGETTVSAEATINFGVANHKANLTWDAVTNAIGYNVYRSVVSGAEQLLLAVNTNSYIDDGSVVAAGAPPAANTTQFCWLIELPLPGYNLTDAIKSLPAATITGIFRDNIAQVNGTGAGGTPTPPGGIPPTPAGGGSVTSSTPPGALATTVGAGNISELPQLLQFANKIVLLLGNNHVPMLSDGTTGGTAAITNGFVAVYPVRAASTAYPTGAIIQATVGATDYVFKVSQGGVTAGGAGPVFPAGLGQTVVDGQVIFVNAGPVTASDPPKGAAHGIIYAGALWLYNTAPTTDTDNTRGPSCLMMSDINNPGSWNPLNVAFIGKDDGTQGTGLASFTIAESGISPTGSLVAFKDFSTYQIIGVFGASDFAIIQAQTDMGNIAPRSIQFLPGFGIARLSHLGVALFDGVRDRLISPEVYPYIFGGEDDIVPLDFAEAYQAKGAQSATPPMYLLAIPLEGAGGVLTRLLCYDLVLKGWTIVDLPFAINCLKTIRIASQGSMPLTLCGDAADGALRRLFAVTDLVWQDVPVLGTNSEVDWSVRTPEVFGKSAADRLALHALYVKGARRPTRIAARLSVSGRTLQQLAMKVTVEGGLQFEALLQTHQLGKNAHADISGTGRVELHSFDWDVDAQPTVPAVLV